MDGRLRVCLSCLRKPWMCARLLLWGQAPWDVIRCGNIPPLLPVGGVARGASLRLPKRCWAQEGGGCRTGHHRSVRLRPGWERDLVLGLLAHWHHNQPFLPPLLTARIILLRLLEAGGPVLVTCPFLAGSSPVNSGEC